MTDTAIVSTPSIGDSDSTVHDNTPAELTAHLERQLALARPRLLRLARLQGVAQDAVEDVAQDVLVIAWRRLGMLHYPERLDAWLDGICRNLCLHQHRHARVEASHQASISVLDSGTLEVSPAGDAMDIGDPHTGDPLEDLTRQDLQTLLDRALSYLPHPARAAVELRYLAELPLSEVASRLGLTINALDVRLHRARKHLRQILNGELRAEAEAYGLALDDEDVTMGWRETRLWCMFCGRLRLHGRLETLPDGRVNLRMRCPSCSPHIGSSENSCLTESGPLDALRGFRSFRPAFHRQVESSFAYVQAASTRRACLWCGAQVHATLTLPDERPSFLPRWPGLTWVIICPGCGWLASVYAGWSAWNHPAVRQFIDQHPRWIMEPESLMEWGGQPAIRVRLSDVANSACLTIFLHAETLHMLAAFSS